MSRTTRPGSDRFLASLLFLVVAAPALLFSWVVRDGGVVSVLYREPKLVAVQALGWAFLACLFWFRREKMVAAEVLPILRRPPFLLLQAFVAYAALTGLWVTVYENFFYELSQYLLLVLLTFGLLWWSRDDASVRGIVLKGMTVSLAVATGIGFLQRVVPIAVLTPIAPEMGVSNPSVMGYKNPMALSLLGQLYLVLALAGSSRAGARARAGLLAVLALELLYLVTLRSRTSYLALAVSAVFCIVLASTVAGGRRIPARRIAAGAALASLILASGFALHPSARESAGSAIAYVVRPASYLESDRGAYLVNTLNMVRFRPFGVGLGDWQTHYPLYRLHQRDRSFSDTFQVRRAHSDHVQFLGELGWPGLVLWTVFLASLVASAVGRYRSERDLLSLCLAAQLVALTVAMVTDYVIEIPYNKLQFFLMVSLVLSRAGPPRREEGLPTRSDRGLGLALAMTVSIAAAVNLYYYVGLCRRIHLSARIQEAYLDATSTAAGGRLGGQALLELSLDLGARLEGLPGHTKTDHTVYLALSQAAFLLERPETALGYARRSLELHPYYPNTMRWMAVIVRARDPDGAEAWERAYRYVMEEATSGFRIAYPSAPPVPSGATMWRDRRRGSD